MLNKFLEDNYNINQIKSTSFLTHLKEKYKNQKEIDLSK